MVELLQAVPTYSRGIPAELVTPVGAAIVSALVEGFGDMPVMRADRVGYGAGHPRLDFPNLLRVVIGEEEPAAMRATPALDRSTAAGPFRPDVERFDAPAELPGRLHLAAEPIDEGWESLVQATVEDPGDEGGRAALLEDLFDAGASDAWLATVAVRGGRSAVAVTAVAPPEREDDVARALRAIAGGTAVRVTPARRPGGTAPDG